MTDELDRLDEELREYGRRWRTTIPPAPVPPLDAAVPDRLRRVPLLVPAAAAAVVVVLLGVALGTGRGAGDAPPEADETVAAPSTSATPDAPEIVPWAPLDPTHPELPRVTFPPSPDPAPAAAAPPCAPADLRATSSVEGAAGTVVLALTIEAASSDVSCRLQGHPQVRFLDRGQAVDIGTRNTPEDSSYGDAVLVADGEIVTLTLFWGSAWCTDPVRNDRVQVAVGTGSVEVGGFGRSPSCNGTPGSGPNQVGIGSFQPQSSRPGRVASAYAAVEGELTTLTDPVPGAELRFQVTLTARGADVRLDPCPDYSMVKQESWDDRSVARFALNCAAVPHRDGDGVPYLPAGVPVRFEMRLMLSGADVETSKSTWTLEAPGGPVLAIPTGRGAG